jgi:hypothetical protein
VKRHRLVYIAGRFRDRSPWVVHQNVIIAEQRAAQVCRYEGLVPMCPHVLTRNLDCLQGEAYWCAATMEIMRRCEALYVGPGWEDSRGTLAEIREALLLAKAVIFEERDLRIYALKGAAAFDALLMFCAAWRFHDSQVFVRKIVIDSAQRLCPIIEVECLGSHEGMGTLAWAISVVSYMRAGGYLNEVPAELLSWIDARIAELQAAWEKV